MVDGTRDEKALSAVGIAWLDETLVISRIVLYGDLNQDLVMVSSD